VWLLKKGNRESTAQRKLKYLKQLCGTPEEMIQQILNKPWCDKSKSNALDAVVQYAEFLGEPIEKTNFRVYQNEEMYVPNPEMVRRFVYRIRKTELRAVVLIAIETGATSSEIHNHNWSEGPQKLSGVIA